MQRQASHVFAASHSKLKTYSNCPRQYYFNYLDESIAPIKRQLQKPRPELEVGNLIHDILFRFFKYPPQDRTQETLKAILKDKWGRPKGEHFGFTSMEEERLWYSDTLLMLKTFFQDQAQGHHLFYVPDPLSREEFIKIPLTEAITLNGRVDRIDEVDGDKLHVIDYKTGKSQQDDDFQVLTYVLLAEKQFGRKVTKASYFYLRTGHWKTYSPGDGDLAVTLEKIKRVIQTIQADTDFAPKPSKLCRWCDFLDYCPAKAEVLKILGGSEAAVAQNDDNDLPF